MNDKTKEAEPKFSKNKIIFLDIDGVLNNDVWMDGDRWTNVFPLGPYQTRTQAWVPYFDFAPENVRIFNKILNETNASIVVSSSWRKDKTPAELEEILIQNGGVDCLGRIIGKTVDHYPNRRFSEHIPRWKFIEKWMKENAPKDMVFVVLDDDHEAWSQGHTFVWTDPRVGLTEDNARHAIQVLNGEYTVEP